MNQVKTSKRRKASADVGEVISTKDSTNKKFKLVEDANNAEVGLHMEALAMTSSDDPGLESEDCDPANTCLSSSVDLKISSEDSNGELLNIAESSNQLGSKDSAMLNSSPLESSKLIFKSPEEERQVSYTQSHDGKVLFTGLVAEDIEICPRIVDKIMIGKPCFSGSAMNWRIPSCIYILYIRLYICLRFIYFLSLWACISKVPGLHHRRRWYLAIP
jgi:hypothetical protein